MNFLSQHQIILTKRPSRRERSFVCSLKSLSSKYKKIWKYWKLVYLCARKVNFLSSMEPSALIKKDDNRFAAVYGFLIQPFKHQVLFYPVPKSVRCDKETNCKTSGSRRRRRRGGREKKMPELDTSGYSCQKTHLMSTLSPLCLGAALLS